jgi:hypothetical protein
LTTSGTPAGADDDVVVAPVVVGLEVVEVELVEADVEEVELLLRAFEVQAETSRIPHHAKQANQFTRLMF